MVNSSISGEQLEYSRRVNNSCCLTNVADGLNNLSFYFTYFENLLKDNVKLQKLLVISDEIEKQKQTIENKYTKISFGETKTESRKLLDYMEMDVTTKIELAGRQVTLKNVSLEIFMSYCYNKSAFGKPRVFKTTMDSDIYLLEMVKKQLYEERDADEGLEDEVTEEEIKNLLSNELQLKYNDILNKQEIDRKIAILLEYNGKVETCVLSGLTKYDIKKNIESLLLENPNKLVDLAHRLNQKIRLSNILHSNVEKPNKVHYYSYSWRDELEDTITTLNLMDIYIPGISQIGILKSELSSIKDKSPKWLEGSILNKNKEFDFIADIINDVGLEQLDNLNSLINKYKVVEDKVSVKKMIKMIESDEDNFLENKKISLSTMLRTWDIKNQQ